MSGKDGPTISESQLDDELQEVRLAVDTILDRTILAQDLIAKMHEHTNASVAEAARVIHEFRECPERPDELRAYTDAFCDTLLRLMCQQLLGLLKVVVADFVREFISEGARTPLSENGQACTVHDFFQSFFSQSNEITNDG